MSDRPDISIIIPLMNEEGNFELLLEKLNDTLGRLGHRYEIIFVDDGSRDGTWSLIKAASERDANIKGISLSRNFGHQNAIFAGLHQAGGTAIISMDGDLQHPPETIPKLVEAWQKGHKIVETTRADSATTGIFKRLTSRWFYRMFSFLSGLPMHQGASDFRLIDRSVAETMKGMQDPELFLRGFSHWMGFRRANISYRAEGRHAGKTKYSLSKMIRFSISAILSFSLVPLKLGIWLGLATSLLAFLEFVYILIRYFQGATVPGWASILTIISFMFGILFILIGIIGAYLGSVFETTKNRPRYIIDETAGIRDE